MTARRAKSAASAGRVNVRFPKELLEELSKFVPTRKRSKLIVQGTERMLAEVKRKAALKAGAGAWSNENHPDLNTQEDINRYLAELWTSTEERLGGERLSD